MFISLNDLKGLVVDLDSFPEEFDDKWVEIDSSISILFLSKDKERLSDIETINREFLAHNGTFYGFLNKRKSLIEVLQILELESFEIAVLSRNLEILKYLQGMNISTIYFSEEDYINYEDVGKLPDFLIGSIEDINRIISGDLIGFFSEAASIIYNGNHINFKQGIVIVTDKEYNNITSTVVSGGRYFSTSDIRYPVHQLSQRIIRNKDYSESQAGMFSSIYSDLVRFIEEQIAEVDALTRIPPRPSQNKDRMDYCVNYVCEKKPHIMNASNSLICVRDYESQKFLNQEERFSNIQGVFRVTDDFKGKHVVVLDDVISTGATALESARELYQAGARRVTILVLAINQFKHFLSIGNKPLVCQCGGELKMRFNSRNNSAFFGCSNYPSCRSSLDFFEGVQAYNRLNKIEVDNEDPEDPEWF
jgi:predicted amidophosphoribosyltransferase